MNYDELLYKYFSETLTETEQQTFDDLLASNPEFLAQFDYENNLKTVIKNEESKKLKDKLIGFEADINKSEKQSFTFNWRIAASIAIFIAAGWMGYKTLFANNIDSLYQDNYQNYPNTVYTITRSDTENSLEREAFVAYETENYQLVIEKFEAITDQKPYFNFYKAQSFLGLNEFEKAKHFFKDEIRNNGQFEAEAQWYLALIALKENQKEEAIKILQTLTENYKYNRAKAESLLKELH